MVYLAFFIEICVQACAVILFISKKYIYLTPNSRARERGQKRVEMRGSMEEFDRRSRGMLTTEEWCNSVSKMLHHV